MYQHLYCYALLSLFFAACTGSSEFDKPSEPSLKGVFLNKNTMKSALTGKEVIYSSLSLDGEGTTYHSKYAQRAIIQINGKDYRFFVDTADLDYIRFWVKNKKENRWEYWRWQQDLIKETEVYDLYFNTYGLKSSYIDTVPPALYGYGKRVDARIFLALISDSVMITKLWNVEIIVDFEMKEFGTAREHSILKSFENYGFDPATQTFYIEKDSVLSPSEKKKRILEMGKELSASYTEKYREDVVYNHFPRHSGASMTSVITEWYILPGDSVWFTGRISGDSVIAVWKSE